MAFNLGLRVFFALIVFFVGTRLIRLVIKLVDKSMHKAKAETGVVQFVDSLLRASLYVLLILFIGIGFGVDATSVAALLGTAGVTIGLALQGSLSNLAGGVMILILKPFVIGDYITESATGKEGTVTGINIFYTKLLTFDGRTVILPNGSLANTSIVNVTAEGIRRADISVSVAYTADIKAAREVLYKLICEDEKTLDYKDRTIFVDSLGESGIDLIVRCWFKNEDYWDGISRLRENIKNTLDNAGIEIPYNKLDVYVKKD